MDCVPNRIQARCCTRRLSRDVRRAVRRDQPRPEVGGAGRWQNIRQSRPWLSLALGPQLYLRGGQCSQQSNPNCASAIGARLRGNCDGQ